jgi:phosphohistidine phosphatase
MQRLILFRHAKAERQAPSGEDFDRDLTERGRRDAALMGKVLAERGYGPDLALVSTARRTRSTWDELSGDALSGALDQTEVQYIEALYNAPARLLLQSAAQAKAAGTVIVIAHNPGLHEASIGLVQQGSASDAGLKGLRSGMPTATAGVFDFIEGRPRLVDWLLARDFGGGGGE